MFFNDLVTIHIVAPGMYSVLCQACVFSTLHECNHCFCDSSAHVVASDRCISKFFSQSSLRMRADCLSAVQFLHRIAQREACGTRERCPVSHARHSRLKWLGLLRCGRGLPTLKADTEACTAEAPCVFSFLPLANSCLSSAVNSHVTRSLCVLCY